MRSKNHILATLVPVVLFAVLPACESPGTHSQKPLITWTSSPVTSIDQIAGVWTLTHIADEPIDPDLKPPEIDISADGRLAGFAGVNRMNATINKKQLADGRFSTGPIATTLMAGPPDAMELEQRFLNAITRADEVRLEPDGAGLVLLLETTDRLLRFQRSREH